MDIKELKTKDIHELGTLLKELRERQRKLNFDSAEKKLKNPHEVGETRKTIARIVTLLKEKDGK